MATPMATADWFILDQLKASRSFNYLMLPSEIVGKVEVFKIHPWPIIDEGGVGGTVNVHTRMPAGSMARRSRSSRPRLQGFHDEKSPAAPIRPARRMLSAGTTPTRPWASWSAASMTSARIRRDGIEVLGYTGLYAGDEPATGRRDRHHRHHRQSRQSDRRQRAQPDRLSAVQTDPRARRAATSPIQYAPTEQALELNRDRLLFEQMDADNFNQNYMAWIQPEDRRQVACDRRRC
jgi:iron complex outermembrane receptor protein